MKSLPGDDDFAFPEKSIIDLHTDMGFVSPLGIILAVFIKHITFAAVDGSAEVEHFFVVAQVQFKGFNTPDACFRIIGRETFQNGCFCREDGIEVHIKIVFVIGKCRIVDRQLPGLERAAQSRNAESPIILSSLPAPRAIFSKLVQP